MNNRWYQLNQRLSRRTFCTFHFRTTKMTSFPEQFDLLCASEKNKNTAKGLLRVWTFSDNSPKTEERHIVIKIAICMLLLSVPWVPHHLKSWQTIFCCKRKRICLNSELCADTFQGFWNQIVLLPWAQQCTSAPLCSAFRSILTGLILGFQWSCNTYHLLRKISLVQGMVLVFYRSQKPNVISFFGTFEI